ncbi:amidohydrolase [Macrococcus armenti]|uniref:amidohydrolase n=1 Tax=Macrococcus armenti TaxID=2875764 RepID=UPI001CD02176|nr:amidohydrolase [Macrococcus armenti]UBH09027.1 amidohydrolase [Macrococcus armenti]UBH11320.1 amidohydrolase [Macrococcus armenti]
MVLKEKLFKKLEEKEACMLEIRRHLHAHPELSFHEEHTAAFIQDFYKDKDVTVHTNVGGGHAVIVDIKSGNPGKVIGLRADFDALPIHEETNLEFKSKTDGVMHACGHDAHTAYLLILAESLIELKDELSGTVRIIHQHAEEVPPGGAKGIVASGILDDLDEVYGIHVFPFVELGKIELHEKATYAGSSTFDIIIQGKGGHAAMPQNTKDAIVAASYLVTQLQTVVSRCTDPKNSVVVTIGSFEAPGTHNVIQGKVVLKGTTRYLDEPSKDIAYEAIKNQVEGLEKSFGVKVDIDYRFNYPVLYNHVEQTRAVRDILKLSEGSYFDKVIEGEPLSGSEDFAYYLMKTPGTFYIVGARPEGIEEPYPNHHPKFEIHEDAMMICAKSLGEVVLNRLAK